MGRRGSTLPVRGERLLVGHRDVAGAAAVLQPGMLGTVAGVVEARGDGMGHADENC